MVLLPSFKSDCKSMCLSTCINNYLSGVLTKVDLINPGGEDEVLSVVNNIRKPLALGYVMVKNRSQLDLNNNMTAAQARYVTLHTISCISRIYIAHTYSQYCCGDSHSV